MIGNLESVPRKDVFVWDTSVVGLGIRVKPSGAKSYVVQYRQGKGRGSKSVRLTIDDISSVTLEDARKVARATLGAVAMGNDPRHQRRTDKQTAQRDVAKVIDAYDLDLEKRQVSPRHRSNSISVLRRGLKNVISRDIASLSRQELVGLIEAIEKLGAQQSFRQRLTPFLNFAVNHGIVAHNILAGWRRPRRSRIQITARSGRTLTVREIRAIWAATEGKSTYDYFIRIMLLTGLRNSETASLAWDWIDKSTGAIIVPGHRMKSGTPHSVPLTTELEVILASLPRLPGSNLLLPVRSKKGTWTTITGFGQILRKVQSRSGTSGWTIYDLRRTFRSFLSDLQYDTDLCERMIAHSRGSLVERYDRSTRWPERKAAAGRYAEVISRVVTHEIDEVDYKNNVDKNQQKHI